MPVLLTIGVVNLLQEAADLPVTCPQINPLSRDRPCTRVTVVWRPGRGR